MAWVRIDDQFYEHPKLVAAGPLGLAMQVAALCYCNRYLTDGFIPRGAAKKLLDFEGLAMRCWESGVIGGGQDASWMIVVEDLEKAGLWLPVDGGWQLHDYLKYQPSKEAVEADRQKTAARVAKFRNGRSNGVTDDVTNGVSNAECNGERNGGVTPAPNPNPNPSYRLEEQGGSPDGAPPPPSEPIPFTAIVDAYNATMVNLPKVREITAARKTAVRTAWQESKGRQSLSFWQAYFEECADDAFLNGTGPYLPPHENWRPDFDYLAKKKTIVRVYERAMDRMEKSA